MSPLPNVAANRVIADMVCRDEDSALIVSAPALAAAFLEAADTLRAIGDYFEAEYREGDKPYQAAIVARAALARLVAFDASLKETTE